jgi:hypothetical protein
MDTTGSTRAKSPSVEAILDALRQHPHATAAELAEFAGIGRSTAGKTLASLEAEAQVTRQHGKSEGRKPTPDRWRLAPDASVNDADAEPEQPVTGAEEPTAEPADTTKASSQAHRVEATPPATGTSAFAEAETAPTTTPAADQPEGEGTSSPRLRPGALRALVHAWLAERPSQEFTPTMIGKELGRSAGAVGNALATMTDQGEVVQISRKPRRYAIAKGRSHADATR